MYKSIIILSLVCLIAKPTFAKIRDLETTRLKSLSGAGVASLLVHEASFLNPASITFTKISSAYFQKGSSHIDNQDPTRTKPNDGNSEIYLLSDTSSPLKGTFSYQNHSENGYQRTRYTSSFASPIGKATAMGLIYRYTIDSDQLNEKNKYHQAVLGLTHIMSKDFIFGATLVDPMLANKEDSKFTVGVQYNITSNILLMVDTGSDYHEKTNDRTFTSAAVQLNFFKDLFFRAGQFHDKKSNFKGQSWGVAWIGPKLTFEYSYKMSELISKKSDYIINNEKLAESSFAIGLIF